ncbi:hypothetical protein TB2_014325 [Malus domestica]
MVTSADHVVQMMLVNLVTRLLMATPDHFPILLVLDSKEHQLVDYPNSKEKNLLKNSYRSLRHIDNQSQSQSPDNDDKKIGSCYRHIKHTTQWKFGLKWLGRTRDENGSWMIKRTILPAYE